MQLAFFARIACALLIAASTSLAHAHEFRAGAIVVEHPYAAPSIPGAANGAAYARAVRNTGDRADRLIGASSPVAARVEIHDMRMDGDVMRMREVDAIEVPAGKEVQLRKGDGYHLMLMELKRPLKLGERFDMTLRFEKAGSMTVEVNVQQPRQGAPADAHGHSHAH